MHFFRQENKNFVKIPIDKKEKSLYNLSYHTKISINFFSAKSPKKYFQKKILRTSLLYITLTLRTLMNCNHYNI